LYGAMADANSDSPFYDLAIQEFERGAHLPGASPLPEQGLILTAAVAGEPVQQQWWDNLLHKLQTNPIGPQELLAVTGLVGQRDKIALDDHMLGRCYKALAARGPLPAHVLAGFGDHALTYLHDEQTANHFFVAATERSDRDYAIQMASVLLGE